MNVSDRGPLRFLLLGGHADDAGACVKRVSDAAGMPIEVVRASTMADALRLLDERPPVDIALLDLELPDIAGLDALAVFHAYAPDVPVLMFTSLEGDYLGVAIRASARRSKNVAADARRVAAMLPRYVENRARDVATLRLGLERGDFETVGRIGHNLRGNGVSFGVPELSALGAQIEAAAYTKSKPELQNLVTRLRHVLDCMLGTEAARPRRTASGTRVRAVSSDDSRITGTTKRER